MSKNFAGLLNKTSHNNSNENKPEETLAEKMSKFDVADKIMKSISDPYKNNLAKDKIMNVTFAIPESSVKRLNMLIRKCMIEGVTINKSEVIRLGILLACEYSFEDLIKRLVEVRYTKGRKKLLEI